MELALLKRTVTLMGSRNGEGRIEFFIDLAVQQVLENKKVLFVSNELTFQALMERINEKLGERFKEKKVKENLNIYLNYMSLNKLEDEIEENHYDLVFIDSINSITEISFNENRNTYTKVSQHLRLLAKKEDISMVIGIPLTKIADGRMPQITDFRFMPNFENDADLIMGMFHGEVKVLKSRIGDLETAKKEEVKFRLIEIEERLQPIETKFNNEMKALSIQEEIEAMLDHMKIKRATEGHL